MCVPPAMARTDVLRHRPPTQTNKAQRPSRQRKSEENNQEMQNQLAASFPATFPLRFLFLLKSY